MTTNPTAAPKTNEASPPNSVAARGRSEWRDVTSMHLAMLDRAKIEARKVICRRMLAEGATTTAIMEVTRKEFGFGIGAGTIRVTDERTTALCGSCSQRVVELSPDEFASWLGAPVSAKSSHTCGICVAMAEVSR